jgi:hypothetical protein
MRSRSFLLRAMNLNCMEQTNSWAKNKSQASLKISLILQKAQFHYLVHKKPTMLHTVNQLSPINMQLRHLFTTNFIINFHPYLDLENGLFLSGSSYDQRSWFHYATLTPAGNNIYKVPHYIVISAILSLAHYPQLQVFAHQ